MNDAYLDIRLNEEDWGVDENSWIGGGSGNIEGGSGTISPDWDL